MNNPRIYVYIRLWEESPRFFFFAHRVRRDTGCTRCRVSRLASKFIPIINSDDARAASCIAFIPRLCEDEKPLQRISASRRCMRTYISLRIRLVRETGFPYVLISRRHRRNSVYTDTPRFLTRLSISLFREINARSRAFSDEVCISCRVKCAIEYLPRVFTASIYNFLRSEFRRFFAITFKLGLKCK